MPCNVQTINIDGVEYVKKDSISKEALKLDGFKYVIIRSRNAGCFAGYLKQEKGQEVVLLKSRRLWYWDGAASLSQLAMEGVKKPDNCKFPCEVNEMTIFEVIEIINCTEEARLSIKGVKVWKQ